MTVLPLELVEVVLDDLFKDFTSLKSCSIVCRTWLPSTRRRLFRHMLLNFETNYETLITILETSPGIADCVRHLEIRGDIGPCPWLDSLARVCTRFTNVESLRIRTIVFQFLSGETIANLFQSLVPVMDTTSILSIEHVVFDRKEQIRDFLSAFSHITDLSLVGCGCFGSVASSSNNLLERLEQRTRCPELRILRLVECYSEVSEALLHATNLSLQHLTLHTSPVNEDDPLLAAYSAAFNSLESLDLQSTSLTPNNALSNFPTKLPALKILVMDVRLFDHPQFNVDWLYQALANLSSTIMDIQLRISGDVHNWNRVDWERVDNTLGPRKFPFLRRVTVEFELFGMMLPEMENLVIENLTRLKLFQRGLLHLSF